MATVRSFHKYRGVSTLTAPELLTIVGELLATIVPRQTKYKVTDVPSERTLRFYTARGLVDKPIGRDGTTSRYGYRHILQLLAVKYLQSQYLPLVKVRSLLERAGNRDLEQLIPGITGVVHRGIGQQEGRIFNTPAGTAPEVTVSLEGPPPGGGAPAASPLPAADLWRHIEVSPGVELHVHADALPDEACLRLRAVLLREMAVLRGWVAEDEKQ
jgi:DNA-binding transcriptional MerR regulator